MSELKVPVSEKIAPVQGYSAGIPWSMHLRAYDAYCKKYGQQAALIDLEGRGCRGGFSTGELDMFIPGWREELSERRHLIERIARLEAENANLRQTVDDLRMKWNSALKGEDDALRHCRELEAQLAALRRPVTVKELKKHGCQGLAAIHAAPAVNDLIRARTEAKEEGK